MRTAIETIATEIIAPRDDVLLLTPLASMEGVVDAPDDAPADPLGDFDAEAFGDARTVLVGVGVGVGVGVIVRAGRATTTTVPLMPAWMEQWYEKEPGTVNTWSNEPPSRITPESKEPSSAVTV
jgi:hypothetical protein